MNNKIQQNVSNMQVKGKYPNKRPRPRSKEKIRKDVTVKVGIWEALGRLGERCRDMVAA
jgi:hypothetical protein